jgi:nickel transport protein
MSRNVLSLIVSAMLVFAAGPPARAHSIHYEVKQGGMAVRAYYSEKDPAAYSQYELFGPGDKEPHQTGRTDRNGYVGFFPDRPGIWKLQVWGESSHGFHGVATEIKVGKALGLEGFSKPLVATYTKAVTGIGIAFGLFGLYALWSSRRAASKGAEKSSVLRGS